MFGALAGGLPLGAGKAHLFGVQFFLLSYQRIVPQLVKVFFCPALGSCRALRPQPTIYTGPHIPARLPTPCSGDLSSNNVAVTVLTATACRSSYALGTPRGPFAVAPDRSAPRLSSMASVHAGCLPRDVVPGAL